MTVLPRQMLLAYLVASQTIAYRTTGEWLGPLHLTECIFLWQREHAVILDWRVRVAAAQSSERVARALLPNVLSQWSTAELAAAIEPRTSRDHRLLDKISHHCDPFLTDL